MQFGLFSNGQRTNAVAKVSYEEDLQEIILADQLGIDEAWISEHGVFVHFHAPDQLPSADLLICKAAGLTKRIRMGPGIRPLPYFHPLQIATEVAVCDHLTDGRYMAGFGAGIGAGGHLRDKLPASHQAIMREAVDIILKAWTEPEPFDWNGTIWQGKNWKIIPQPLTRPHPTVGIACSSSDKTLEFTAEKGFSPLMSWTNPVEQITAMIDTYLRTPNASDPPKRERIRVARYVYVADSVEQAKHDLRNVDLVPVRGGKRLDPHIPPGGTLEDVTLDRLIERDILMVGPPDRVYGKIADFYEQTGGFGTLLLVTGKHWATSELRAQSMRRFMSEVAPRLLN